MPYSVTAAQEALTLLVWVQILVGQPIYIIVETNMRRVFVIRKDLHLKPGKMGAMLGHLCEAYWTNLMKASIVIDNEFMTLPAWENYGNGKEGPALYKHPDLYRLSKEAYDRGEKHFTTLRENARKSVTVTMEIPKDIWDGYVNDIFTKTICEARNLNNLKTKIEPVVKELGLIEWVDWGYINDKCLTDLTPENEDGTTTIGAWFKPLPDEDAFKISKKFKLYRDD